MIYGYIRVSTDKQSNETQRFEIKNFCKEKGININVWIEETISSTKKLKERRLGKLLKKLKSEDTLIISEISRLGRNLMQIMSILHYCMEHNVLVLTTKERYELGNNINSKLLAFAFGLSAEIERNLISQRTKEALARRRAEGVKLGRPKGSHSAYVKLSGKEEKIRLMRQNNVSISELARRFKTSRVTVRKFIKERL